MLVFDDLLVKAKREPLVRWGLLDVGGPGLPRLEDEDASLLPSRAFAGQEGEGMQKDARCAPRIRPGKNEPIEIQLMSEQFLDIFDARDISTSGVGIYVPYCFEGCDLKSPVTLVITLPGIRPFIAKGRVIHRSKTEREFFGVEFIELSRAQEQAIARYVGRRLAEGDCSERAER